MTRRAAALGLAAVMLAGCATLPEPTLVPLPGRICQQQLKPRRLVCVDAPPMEPARAAQARALAPMGPGSTVYILRQHWSDDIKPVSVSAGAGTPLATLPRSLVRLQLPPGEQLLRLQWQGGSYQLRLQARAGEVRVLRLEGWVFWSLREYWLTPMEAAEARPLLDGLRFLGER